MSELKHYGIKGMRKGVRRFQNADGSLNALGERRYGVGQGTSSSTSDYAAKRNAAAQKQSQARADQARLKKPTSSQMKSMSQRTGGLKRNQRQAEAAYQHERKFVKTNHSLGYTRENDELTKKNEDTLKYQTGRARRGKKVETLDGNLKEYYKLHKYSDSIPASKKPTVSGSNKVTTWDNVKKTTWDKASSASEKVKSGSSKVKNSIKDKVQKVKDKVQQAKSKIVTEEVKNVNLKPGYTEPKTSTGQKAKEWFQNAVKKKKK